MHFSDQARRARLATRHALRADHRLDHPTDVARALVALHATEPATVHLAVAARMNHPSVAAVESALYDERSLVKQLAMRRTLFAFARESLAAAWGSASARVAEQERARLARDLERHSVSHDGAAWIERGRAAVLQRLAQAGPSSARQLREALPELAGRTTGAGAATQLPNQPLAPRLLTVMGAEHSIVRGTNLAHWRTSRPAWTLAAHWLPGAPEALSARAGYAELVRRWLASFGPGTEADLVWWLGATKSAVRAALTDVAATTVRLDSGATGYVLPGDHVEDEPDGDWVALLPVLDPTLMGWRERDFYLPPDLVPYLFDSNGNGGSTAWVNGRVVGGWVQDDVGRVLVRPLHPLADRHRRMLQEQAERLTALLDGVVIATFYKSQLMKGEVLP